MLIVTGWSPALIGYECQVRVMHVATNLGTYGAERFLTFLLERIDEPGLELAVLTIVPARDGDAPRNVIRFSAERRARFDVGCFFRMLGALRRWRPDIVHTHTHHGKYWGRLAAIAAGVPTIVHTEHNSEFGAPNLYRPFDRALLKRTDRVVTFSVTQRDRLIAQDHVRPEKIAIIPNGLPLKASDPSARERVRAELGAHDGQTLAVHVGRLSAVKNQSLAIEALAKLDAGVHLVLVGDGNDRPALEALARRCGVEGRTMFLGYRPDAAALLAGADVTLVTSRNEAMPLAVIEAMLAGSPLVSTPWEGAAEMLGAGQYGVIASDFTAAAYATAVRSVLDDPAASRARATSAEICARREYDIAVTARRHVALYRELSALTRSRRCLNDPNGATGPGIVDSSK